MGQCRRREARAGNHSLDWTYAGDRLLREWKPERYRAEQFAVDINGAAAHALQHTGFGERAAAEARENDRLFWRDIFQDSEDLDLELLDLTALENGAANAAEAWVDFFDGEEPLGGGGAGAGGKAEDCEECATEKTGIAAKWKQWEHERHSRLAGPASGFWRRKSQCD